MELFAHERDRLLRTTTRFVGITCTVISVVAVGLLVLDDPGPYLLFAACCVAMILVFVVVGRSDGLPAIALGLLLSVAAAATIFWAGSDTVSASDLGTALIPLLGGAAAAFGLLLASSARRMLVGGLAAVTVIALLGLGLRSLANLSIVSVAAGWILSLAAGFWISRGVPRAARRIYSIGNAHRAERQASETEAQRRQGARLLHDTVLATLTLLAHSGVGVAPEALRSQAAEDARLLRHLRLGATPQPQSSGDYHLDTVEPGPLGQTLESVKQRFGRMGLEVSWHGTGQVLLPSDVLDAFLLALAECLENVRRHAGVTDAHVTIIHDEKMVRAIVTDAGVGFDLAGVSEVHLGLKESVVSRLREVGGGARLFSAPGAGTTVVLEAPR